jgi:hypothetical protein
MFAITRAAKAAPRERPAPAVARPSLVVATYRFPFIYHLVRPEHRRNIAYHAAREAGQMACEQAVVMLELRSSLARCARPMNDRRAPHSPTSTFTRHLRAHTLSSLSPQAITREDYHERSHVYDWNCLCGCAEIPLRCDRPY